MIDREGGETKTMAMANLMCICCILMAMAMVMSGDGCEGDRKDIIRECGQYHKWPAEPKLDP
jgi:hypothetical protein